MDNIVATDRSLIKKLLGFIGGIALAISWLYPATWIAVISGWCSVLCILTLSSKTARDNNYFPLYIFGTVSHALAFWWLIYPIKSFGEFSNLSSILIFIFFVGVAAGQFVLFGFVNNHLPKKYNLAPALAWNVSENIFFRIFPWTFGHTQLAFTPLALSARLGGAQFITFLMIWLATSYLRTRKIITIPFIIIICSIGYGIIADSIIKKELSKTSYIKASVIQGGVTMEKRGGMNGFVVNSKDYLALTRNNFTAGSLVIWPETALQFWIPANLSSSSYDNRIPLNNNYSFLTGGLTFENRSILYNSAIGIDPDHKIKPPYHKQYLMPFGEYLPLSSVFSLIGDLKERIGGLTAGTEVINITLPIKIFPEKKIQEITITPLICYEDLVTDLSIIGTRKGGNILVNLTNDAWFGNTVAPYQHHLIASFRAIENNRVLIRATHNGVTGIVLPNGITNAQLPQNSVMALNSKIQLLNKTTPFSKIAKYNVWFLLAIATIIFIPFYSKIKFSTNDQINI
jgi:apolipoprotein N-acyltransferase